MKNKKKAKKAIWSHLQNYKFNSILINNFLIIIIIVVIPFGILSIIYRDYSIHVINCQVSEANMYMLQRNADVMDNLIKEVYTLSSELADNVSVIGFISDVNVYEDNVQATQHILKNYTNVFKYIDSIYIYSGENKLILSSSSTDDYFHFKDKRNNWYNIYMSYDYLNDNFTLFREKDNNFPNNISIFHMVKIEGIKSGVIIININPQKLGQFIQKGEAQSAQDMFILNRNDCIIYCSNESIFSNVIDKIDYLGDLSNIKSGFTGEKTIVNQRKIMSVLDSKYGSWRYALVSQMGIYTAKKNKLDEFIIRIIILEIFASILISYFITIRTYKPVGNILDILDNPDKNQVKLSKKGPLNELLYISNNILNTINANKQMEGKLEDLLALLYNAQTLALQAQINPHFLYNTLDSIKWLAMEEMNGENMTSNMIQDLASLLRMSLDTDNMMIPLRNEIEQINLYTHMLNLRHMNKFTVIWDVEENLLDLSVIKLTLQPLIENAVYHGLKPKRYVGKINIKVKLINDTLIISITDDGIGMDQLEIDKLNDSLRGENYLNNKLIGIRNVNQRIKLMYGEEYGVVITRNVGDGISALVILPKIQ